MVGNSNCIPHFMVTEEFDLWGQDPGRRMGLPLITSLVYLSHGIKVSKLEYFFGSDFMTGAKLSFDS